MPRARQATAPAPDEMHEARVAAVRLLARREHSKDELRRKLKRRGHGQAIIDTVIGALDEAAYVSDTRFAEMFVRVRRARGQGPVRIRAELRQRGVEDALADDLLTETAEFWIDLARTARARRFGDGQPVDRDAWNRQARFLAQRGFPADLIYRALGNADP